MYVTISGEKQNISLFRYQNRRSRRAYHRSARPARRASRGMSCWKGGMDVSTTSRRRTGTLIAANFLLFTLDFKHLESVESFANEKMMQARRRCMEEDRLLQRVLGQSHKTNTNLEGGMLGEGRRGLGQNNTHLRAHRE